MSITRRSLLATASAAAALRWAKPAWAASTLRVVTTTEDLAALAREVGGDHISVESIARGYQDPHFVEPKPSFILKLNRADLVIAVGLQLEIAWLPPLITQSRNSRIQPAGKGYFDASQFAVILEKPVGAVSRAMGDVHPLGNPHYWLDPENGRRIAQGLAAKLAEMMPEAAADFQHRYDDFSNRLKAAEQRWEQKMTPYRGRRVITYHQSWPSFAERFGLQVEGYVEPKPGIPPSPSHTLQLINEMKRENIHLIWVEPYFDTKVPNSIAQAVGGEAIVLLPSVGGTEQVNDYFKLFDYDTDLVAKAFDRVDKK